jgi:excisionase family DNA binding protein
MSIVQLPSKPFISVPDAAALLGCTEGRVRQLIYEGTITGMKLNERAWAVDRKSVESYAKRDISTGRPRVASQG